MKATIILGREVYKQIKWFTFNFDKEIGAIGTGKIGGTGMDKFFFIDKLYFPKQEVTAASVDFSGNMWGDLIKEMPEEDLKRVCFYWHKHPGSAHHSSTDETDTFGAFMNKDSGRKFFVFLQTANSSGNMDFESRIDISLPIRATITNDLIDLKIEQEKEDLELEKKCKNILETVIVEKKYTPVVYDSGKWPVTGYGSTTYPKSWGSQTKITEQTYYSNLLDKNLLAELDFENGEAKIMAGARFNNVASLAMDDSLKGLFVNPRVSKEGEKIVLKLQPTAGNFKKLKEEIMVLYNNFNTTAYKADRKENEDKSITLDPAQATVVQTDLQAVYECSWYGGEMKIEFEGETYGYFRPLPDGSAVLTGEALIEMFTDSYFNESFVDSERDQ